MVPEPASSAVQVIVAGISATIFTITGVTFHGLLWGMLGAIVMLMMTPPQERGRAIFAVFCGAVCGAVLSDMLLGVATAFAGVPDKTAESMHLGSAFIIGGGFKQIFSAMIAWAVARAQPKGDGQ